MNTIGIIPARYQSTRLPGKPLADINGTSMIMRVYNQALKANLKAVVVATDDQRILDHVIEHGGKAVITSSEHPSGTDRCLEAALTIQQDVDAVINIQGDEPFIEPRVINELVNLVGQDHVSICTLVKEFGNKSDLSNPNRVKVTADENGKALSFSRKIKSPELKYFQHLGIYGYTLSALKEITQLDQSPMELEEKLEQLRWFENGFDIYTALVEENSICVDTPEDLEKARGFQD